MIDYTDSVTEADIGRPVQFYQRQYVVCAVAPPLDEGRQVYSLSAALAGGALKPISRAGMARVALVDPDGDEHGPKVQWVEAHSIARGGVTIMHWLRDDPAVKRATVDEARELLHKADEAEQSRREAQRNADAEAAQRNATQKAEFQRLRPAWAVSVLVARSMVDKSDTMTDYFDAAPTRRVLLAWSKHCRDNFAEMRKAAALFPNTAHLATAGKEAEHREKWSMGAGYYLKASGWYSDGWEVRKEDFAGPEGWVSGETDIIAAQQTKPSPAKAEHVASGAAYAIEKHYHDKRGCDFWLVVLAERVERDEFDRLRAASKVAGGWYSRKWGDCPGGFAFTDEDAAQRFAAGV